MAKRPRSNTRKPRNAKSNPLTPDRGTREEDLPRLTTAQRIAHRLKARHAASGPAEAPGGVPTSKPTDQVRKVVWAFIRRWQRAGWLSGPGFPAPKVESSLGGAKRELREEAASIIGGGEQRLTEHATFFLRSLEKKHGLNVIKVEHILRGKLPPHVDVFGLYEQWASLNRYAKSTSNTRKAIQKLRGYYRDMNSKIQSDPVLLSDLKSKWQAQHVIIQIALDQLKQIYSEDNLKPYGVFTVRLDKPLSKQGFWTTVVTALVECWEKVVHNRSLIFRQVAELLAFAFPGFPNDPALVRRRYYHAQKMSRS